MFQPTVRVTEWFRCQTSLSEQHHHLCHFTRYTYHLRQYHNDNWRSVPTGLMCRTCMPKNLHKRLEISWNPVGCQNFTPKALRKYTMPKTDKTRKWTLYPQSRATVINTRNEKCVACDGICSWNALNSPMDRFAASYSPTVHLFAINMKWTQWKVATWK